MKSDSKVSSESAISRPTKRTQVVCDYKGGYSPPFNVTRAADEMIKSVPSKYLTGLSEIVLTNTAGLPRKLRRSVTKSRGRKVKQAATAGLYFQEWNNRPAWIQIYVDNTLAHWNDWFWFFLPIVRRMALGRVLFHEIGHHIHATSHPEHREKEDVADDWKDKLFRNYFRSRYPWLRFMVAPLRPFLKRYTVAKAQKLYRARMISRHEFEKSMK